MLISKVATLQDNSAHGDDNFLTRELRDNSFLDVVMDGVTGHGGEEASRTLKEALAEASITSMNDVEEVLKDVNEEFHQIGGGRFLMTTISAALYVDGKLDVIGAGDSPVFIVTQNSHQQLAGRIGGFLHVGVARAIGAGPELTGLSHSQFEVQPGHRLVLSTDGLSDNMLIDDLADMVRKAASPEEAATSIDEKIERYLQEGRMPERLGRRFRHDDRTAIFRFFDP